MSEKNTAGAEGEAVQEGAIAPRADASDIATQMHRMLGFTESLVAKRPSPRDTLAFDIFKSWVANGVPHDEELVRKAINAAEIFIAETARVPHKELP